MSSLNNKKELEFISLNIILSIYILSIIFR